MNDACTNPGGKVSDHQLMAQVAQGDAKAMEQLFYRHYGYVLGFLKSRDIGETRAEDLAQEVFAIVWKQAKRYQSTSSTARGYLIAIARNQLRQSIRSQIRYTQQLTAKAALEQDRKPDSPDAVQTMMSNAMLSRLGDILNDLPGKHRQLINLIYWQGLSIRETARQMNCTRYKCESMLQECHNLLQKAYSNEEF